MPNRLLTPPATHRCHASSLVGRQVIGVTAMLAEYSKLNSSCLSSHVTDTDAMPLESAGPTKRCPIMPPMEELPFGADRTSGWKAVQELGDVAMSHDGSYFLIGADAVNGAAKDVARFSSEGAFAMLGSPIPLIPIGVDPPVHSRYRMKLNKFFGPRAMAQHEAEFRSQIDRLIDRILDRGPICDVVEDLAVPFPTQVFLTLFGLPIEDSERLIRWKNAIVRLIDPQSATTQPEVLGAAAELFAYLSQAIQERRVGDGADLLSQLIADRDGGGLTDEEVLGICFVLVVAGLDTVTASIGFVLLALARNPGLRQRLRADESARMAFIEEVLRVDGPVPSVPRFVSEDVVVDGVTIPSGATCWLMFGSASRDPRRYEAPDDIGEQRVSNFAFGRGPHRCLGSHLALLELKLIVEQWLDRVPHFDVVGSPEVLWPSGSLSLISLPLRIGLPDGPPGADVASPQSGDVGSISASSRQASLP